MSSVQTSPKVAAQSATPSAAKVALNFGLLYLLWGSTYLAIRISDESIPPAVMGTTRYLVAGALMLAWCAVTRRRVAVSAQELWRLAVIGVLLLTTGNVMLAFAELTVPSGLSALIVAVVPLWVMVLEWLMFRERLAARGLIGLALGLVGLVVLIWPQLATGGALGRKEWWGVAALMEAAFSWALGSVLSKKWKLAVTPLVASGWEMLLSGAVNLLLALALGSFARTVWAPRSVAAIGYLIVFGSWLGFSAFVWLLGHVPTSKVSTYAYVNPAVAVFLGWLILHERVDRFVLAGTVIIIASVVLVTTSKLTRTDVGEPRPALEPAIPACEPGAD
jgi:drug/metabolite transporter (DMT)-like permease